MTEHDEQWLESLRVSVETEQTVIQVITARGRRGQLCPDDLERRDRARVRLARWRGMYPKEVRREVGL